MNPLKELRDYIKKLLKIENKKPQDDETDDTTPVIQRDHENTSTSISVEVNDLIYEVLEELHGTRNLGIPTVDDIDKMPTPTYDDKPVRVVELKEEER